MMRLLVLLCLLLTTPAWADLKVAVGTYTGNATDNRDINISSTTTPSVTNFTPKAVFIKCDNTLGAAWATSAMSADLTYRPTTSTAGAADLIQSFAATGFQIGADARVNDTGVTCWYLALGGSQVAVGTYTEDNTDPRDLVTSPAIQPIAVLAQASAASGSPMWINTTGTDSSCTIPSANSCAADFIQAFNADGFEVGNGTAGVNDASGNSVYYLTIASAAGQTATGTFTGTTNDPETITSVGFQPDFVLIKGVSVTSAACVRFKDQVGDDSIALDGATSKTNAIQSLTSNGFTTGTDSCANENTVTMRYLALKAETTVNTAFPQIIVVE